MIDGFYFMTLHEGHPDEHPPILGCGQWVEFRNDVNVRSVEFVPEEAVTITHYSIHGPFPVQKWRRILWRILGRKGPLLHIRKVNDE